MRTPKPMQRGVCLHCIWACGQAHTRPRKIQSEESSSRVIPSPGCPQKRLGKGEKSQCLAGPQMDSLSTSRWDPGFGTFQSILRPSDRLLTSGPQSHPSVPPALTSADSPVASEVGLYSYPLYVLQPAFLLSRARPHPYLAPANLGLQTLESCQQGRWAPR